MHVVAAKVEVCFEHLDVKSERPAFGVAKVTRSMPDSSVLSVGQRVLAPTNPDISMTREIDERECVSLEQDLPSARAMLVPDLALALAICASARLELGEIAVYSSGARHEALIGLVAGWCTGRDVIRIDFNDGAGVTPAGVQKVDGSDPQRALEIIQRSTRNTAGFAAIVLSSKAEAMDVLLEAMPTWGRLVVASRSTESATIDFYNNVHRKGVTVLGMPASPRCMFEPERRTALSPFLIRAMRVMQNDALATACLTDMT